MKAGREEVMTDVCNERGNIILQGDITFMESLNDQYERPRAPENANSIVQVYVHAS
jgi:hypothetical protein